MWIDSLVHPRSQKRHPKSWKVSKIFIPNDKNSISNTKINDLKVPLSASYQEI